MFKLEIMILLVISMTFNSCMSLNDQLNCLDSLNFSWKNDDIYSTVRSNLDSSLTYWINNKVKSVQHYKNGRWKIDKVVFFNSSKTAAILLILKQNTIPGVYSDNIQLVFGKFESNSWKFYIKTMNTIGVQRSYVKDDPETPYSFDELSLIARKKIIEGGYIKNLECKINDKYIDDWYNDMLIKKHQEFLNER